jgi:signal transduction histidine kinase
MSQPSRDLNDLRLTSSADGAVASVRGLSPLPGPRPVLSRLNAQLNRLAAGENVLPEFALELRVVFGLDLVVVERYDAMEHRVRIAAHAGIDPPDFARLDLARGPGQDRTLFGFHLGEAAFSGCVSEHPGLARNVLGLLRVATMGCAPIRCGHQVVGALSVGARRPVAEEAGLSEALQGLADHLGSAWTASRLVELSREHSRLEHAARDGWVLAHELRNPLHTMALQLASLRHRVSELPAVLQGDLDRGLQTLEEETVRLHALLQHHLRLGQQRPELRRARVHLHDLLDGVLRFYELPLRTARIDVESELPPEPVAVFVDVAQISQVLHNLLRNALDAMPCGGRLALSTCCGPRTVEVQLCDSGPGIADPEAAFTFFASTRPGGTGLGLPVSREILRAHGGDLTILTSTSGASLVVSLPLADSDA